MIKQLRLGFLSYEVDDFRENRLGRKKQFGVIPRTAFVPIAKRLPFVPIWPATENIALGGKNEIRVDRECEICQSGFEQIDRATRINRPDRARVTQFANQFHALRIENRFADTRNERAVEIDAEQLN